MRRFLLVFFALAVCGLSQGGNPPKCQFSGNFNITGQGSIPYDNRINQCGFWVFNYFTGSPITAINIQLAGANDNNGNPGSFAALPLATNAGGSNPSTSIGYISIQLQGNAPWLQAQNLSMIGVGAVAWQAYGWISATVAGAAVPSISPVISCLKYGCTCNGSGVGDTAGINTAIANAPFNGTVLIPNGGVCILSSPIVINRSNVALAGSLSISQYVGPLIEPAVHNMDLIDIGNGTTTVTGVGISNLVLGGPAAASTSGYGIFTNLTSAVSVNHVYIAGSNKMWRGIYFHTCVTCIVTDSQVDSVLDKGTMGDGITSSLASDFKIYRSTYSTNCGDAIWVGPSIGGIFFEQNEIYAGTCTAAWAINAGDAVIAGECCLFIENNEIESTAGDMGWLNIANWTERVVITGNTLTSYTPSSSGTKIGIQFGANTPNILVASNRMKCGGANFYCIFSSTPLTVVGNSFDGGNYLGVAQNADLVRLFTGSDYTFTGNNLRNSTGLGLECDSGAQNVSISGNSFFNVPVSISVQCPTGLVMSANVGIDNAVPTVASAATITLPPNPIVAISGTTPISTMNGFYIGEKVDLIFTNATPGGLVSGGNIIASVVPQSSTPLHCVYFSSWSCDSYVPWNNGNVSIGTLVVASNGSFHQSTFVANTSTFDVQVDNLGTGSGIDDLSAGGSIFQKVQVVGALTSATFVTGGATVNNGVAGQVNLNTVEWQPVTDNTVALGDGTHRWSAAFINNLTASTVTSLGGGTFSGPNLFGGATSTFLLNVSNSGTGFGIDDTSAGGSLFQKLLLTTGTPTTCTGQPSGTVAGIGWIPGTTSGTLTICK